MQRCTLVIAVAMAAVAAPVAGQVRGVVSDSAGNALYGVTVELWGADSRLAVAISGDSGAFSFPAGRAAGARGLVLSAPGYRTAAVLVSPGDTLLRIQLAVQVVPLPELTALVARQACPNQEEAAARALWIAARERYAATTPAHGYAYWANEMRESVEPERVGQVRGLREVLVSQSVAGGRQVWGGVVGGVFRRLALDEEVRRNG